MSIDIMLDIKTLGVEPGCVILSIGATDGINNFSIHIDIEDSCRHGLLVEPRTVMWWMEQDDTARKMITEPGTSLEPALNAFISSFDWSNSRVWGNDADFPILQAAMKKVGLKLPWSYYAEMDFRTLKNLVPKDVFQSLRVQPAVAHDSLEDAKAQHATLMNLLDYLNTHYIQMLRSA